MTSRFQRSFLDWVSWLKGFAGFYGAASILFSGKNAVLGFTNSLESSIASQSRFSSEDMGVGTFGTNSQEAFDCFAKSSLYFGNLAAIGTTSSL
jgi:hypothetical protein